MANDPESVRESYDRIAAAYARQYGNELLHKPFDRELLHRFATEVKGRGDVCDVGCGPGHIGRYLRDIGLAKVFGLDLLPAMIEQARKLNADLSFKVGNVMALDLVDASVGGIVAFYAIVNIPPNLLPTVFREMLLLTFHIGDEIVQPTEILGQPTSMQFFFLQPATITKQLEAAGFAVEDVVERGPYAPEVEYQSRRAYILAAKAE